MKKRVFTTPEGVRDIYGSECSNKLKLESNLRNKLHLYGFEDIETPVFEFFDIFSEERGTVRAKDMYKFFDRDGNTLVLRPDMTPPIARCAGKYFKDEAKTVRLCYCAHTFLNFSEYQGKMKEVTQLGCELINDPSIVADAEMLAATIDCLLSAGLTEFRLDVGDVRPFKALVEEAGLEEDKIQILKDYIVDKNSFGVMDFLNEENVSNEMKAVLTELPQFFGGVECLERFKELTSNKEALQAIDHLKRIYELMKVYGFEKYISFDLGMISKYRYYTGIIFHAFTYDIGEPVASGGRYDRLIGQFGKDAAAIGMAIITDKLLLALTRQGLLKTEMEKPEEIQAGTDLKDAVKKAVDLRKQGIPCTVSK